MMKDVEPKEDVADAPKGLNVGDVVAIFGSECFGPCKIVKKDGVIAYLERCYPRQNEEVRLGGYHVECLMPYSEYLSQKQELIDKVRSRTDGSEPFNVQLFREFVNEMFDTYKRKNADYGDAYSKGFALFGYNQLLSRIYEKFCRVHHLLLSDDMAMVSESVEETLADMATQCICLRILLREQSAPRRRF